MSKVSVIIPIYNVENYVRKTIESVVCQTEPDIEIILVDDGSTDHSRQICDAYARQDCRIMVIHKENGGLSSARNAGTAVATSDYVMFLDGDDYLKQNAVERAYKVMKEYPSDFVQFLYQEVEEGEEPAEQMQSKPLYQAHTSRELFENLYRLGGVAASGATKLFRRELMLQIPFENIQHEDEMWCTKAFQKNLTVTYISDELYYYVMRKGSIIHSEFNSRKMDVFKVIDRRISVLQQLHLFNLVSKEYEKLFLMILKLYRDAKESGDISAANEIRKVFENEKKKIYDNAHVRGKYKVLLFLMKYNFSIVNIYCSYWKIRY